MKMENDLGRDKVSRLVFRIAIPSMLAQFVNVLYSIVDRMFVGNIPEYGDVSLAGVGICGPVVTMIGAFAFLIGVGGTPLMGIAMGEKNRKRASEILANCFVMLIATAAAVTVLALSLREPMLRLFGASDVTYPYAEKYFTVYVSGTVFALTSIGMYQFIIAQGYAKVGMCSVIMGAVLNMILDPVFIFVLKMGVTGAAAATVISQAASAVFVTVFLLKKADISISFRGYSAGIMLKVLKIGFSPFIIIFADNVMIISLNALLQKYGGARSDMLITVNTITQSFMLVLTMPLSGISGGTQCILSYNFGAGNSERVIRAEKYIIGLCVGYTTLLFILAWAAGRGFVSLFTSDPDITAGACRAIRISTLMAIPLGLQYPIVDGFTAMSQVQLSLPLSFWRKLLYFVSIFVIPVFGDASMIFFAEPISDFFCLVVSVPVFALRLKKILRRRELSLGRSPTV
ncbi:MAG: MATE family efflux transporter [Candidatus Limivicinus sp.]|jgi:putative MATE family efflux protein